MGIVGRIVVRSNRADWTENLGRKLDDWLVETKWEKAVSLARKTVRGKKDTVEVVFHPGEYQSNRLRRFKFSSLPNAARLEQALADWLFKLG